MSFHAVRNTSRGIRRIAVSVTAAAAALTLAACGSPASPGTGADDARVYENKFGSVQLPETIERIVSVDFYTPAALLDLGVTPVGVVNSYFADDAGDGIPLAYTDAIRASDAESIGEYYELNLEAIVKAAPDLVFATQDFLPLDDPMRAEIEKIAPIVTFDARDGEAWRTRSVELAKILDKEAQLQPLVDRYNARRDEIATEYSDVLEQKTVAVFGPEPDEWGTYAATHFSTPILRDLGARFREQQNDEITEDGFPQWFSYEELGRVANADVMFMRLGVSDEQQAALDANTIWQNLPAVKNGMVFEYIPRSPTGSFGWALDNLDSLEVRFGEVRAKMQAQNG